MNITIWGSRGSIPSPGPDTVRYGGDTTCLEINSRGYRLIVDAGSGIRKLGQKMLREEGRLESAFFLTHMHWDHMSGFPFFRPAYKPEFRFFLCGGAGPQHEILKYLQHQMDPPYFPVDSTILRAEFLEGCVCENGDCRNRLNHFDLEVRCESIPLNHPNGGYGLKMTDGDRKFVFLTDNEIRFAHPEGLSRDAYVAFCRGADLLIHDAQYTEKEYRITRSWGHSTFDDAVDLALEAGVRRLGLYHHDPDRTDIELDELVEYCRERIAGKDGFLECFACADGMTLEV